ncbi:spore germination protein KB [Paenibacillus albidus]|uniref:Spore germination protein KB n=1 Tax=Paenibacillus albidus TaxID=2041023 RepID=A0A917CZ29_9BACL|nr:endospore germination permease [Paenibacillus albidus]GGG00465.1 spore germination protein KB [Paenibacillus albidus]
MNGKIGTTQAAMLVVTTVLPTAIVILPQIIGEYVEQDSVIAIIPPTLAGLGIAFVIGSVIRFSNGAPFLDWIREKSSPVISVLLGLLLLLFYLDTSSTILREFVNFVKDNVLLKTPVAVIATLILLISIYMVRKGIEVMARVNSLVILLFLFFVPLYLSGLWGEMNIHRLLPLFDHSAASLLLASLTPSTWMSEVAVLLFLAPYLRSPQKARLIGYLGLLFVSLMMLFSIITILMVLGPQYIKLTTYPGFSAASIIQIGRFIENLDVLFISYWVMAIYLKFAIFLFATVECFKQTFRVSSSRPFIAALGLVIVMECLYTWKDQAELNLYNKEGRFLVFILFNAILPLAVLLVVKLRRSRHKRKECET